MWTQHTAPDGRTYYHNAALGKSSWSVPADYAAQQQQSEVWEEHRAPDGRVYWYNRATKQSKWTKEGRGGEDIEVRSRGSRGGVTKGVGWTGSAAIPSTPQYEYPGARIPLTSPQIRPIAHPTI